MNKELLETNTIEQYLKEAFLLQGQLQALNEEKKVVMERVKNAKIWLQKQPEYLKFLQHLQTILHQKNIGAFSELLSFFVHDVLQKDKKIVLELYTYHNLPALKIEASNDGNRENIIEGNGGSIANIVSTGLRLIALSRMNNRKFIVLDEPDCWLKPEHVPLFAKIIGEISNKLNIQTVIVSHHHWKYFKDYGRVLELKSDGMHLTTEIIHDTPILDNTNDDVIKNVILRRMMSHYDTHFPLHPNLTCIVGENDLGKSVFTTSLKCISYNDSSDSYIMHKENEAQIIVELNNDRKILWQRFRVTDQENVQKVKYTLFKNTEKPISEYSAHDVPEFISKELNISTVEDIDVHIGNQKQPIFLLSPDIKPKDKAKILSLGKESLVVQKMMEYIKNKNKQNKQTESEGELRFQVIKKQISALDNIETIIDQLENLKTEVFYLQKQKEKITQIEQTIKDLSFANKLNNIEKIPLEFFNFSINNTNELEKSIHDLQTYHKLLKLNRIEFEFTKININNTVEIENLIYNLKKDKLLSEITKINFEITEIFLNNTNEIAKTINILSKFNGVKNLTPIEINFNNPVLHNLLEINQIIDNLKEQEDIKLDLNTKKNNLDQWKVIIDQDIDNFIKENKNLCPTCHQHIDKKHILGINHA